MLSKESQESQNNLNTEEISDANNSQYLKISPLHSQEMQVQINNKYNEILQTVAKSQGFRPQLRAMLVQEPSDHASEEAIPSTSTSKFWKYVERIVGVEYPDQRPENDFLELKDIEGKPFSRKELYDYYSKYKSLAKLTAAKRIQETNLRPKEIGVDFENLLKGIKECRNINLSLLKFLLAT